MEVVIGVVFTILREHVRIIFLDNLDFFLFLELPLQHLLEKQIGLFFKKVKYYVLSVAFTDVFLDIALSIAIRTKINGFYLDAFLLPSSQKESLFGHVCDMVDQADSMINVVAVEKTDELVGNSQLLIAKMTVIRHSLNLGRVKLVFENWLGIRLYFHVCFSNLIILDQEHEDFLPINIERMLILGMNYKTAALVYLFNPNNIDVVSLFNIDDVHQVLFENFNEIIQRLNLVEFSFADDHIEEDVHVLRYRYLLGLLIFDRHRTLFIKPLFEYL